MHILEIKQNAQGVKKLFDFFSRLSFLFSAFFVRQLSIYFIQISKRRRFLQIDSSGFIVYRSTCRISLPFRFTLQKRVLLGIIRNPSSSYPLNHVDILFSPNCKPQSLLTFTNIFHSRLRYLILHSFPQVIRYIAVSVLSRS